MTKTIFWIFGIIQLGWGFYNYGDYSIGHWGFIILANISFAISILYKEGK